MQKIMFEHRRFGLEQAVIAGTKTMTRRRIHFPGINDADVESEEMGIDEKGRVYYAFYTRNEDMVVYPKYQIGEEVAIAQCYKDADVDPHSIVAMVDEGQNMFTPVPAVDSEGWNNKMFVRADLMPHVIEITDIKTERLQDISDEDCLREGITKWLDCYIVTSIMEHHGQNNVCFDTPREAFAAIINALNGRVTWERNEWQFAYTFKLVK